MRKKSFQNHRDEGRGFSDTLALSGLWGFVALQTPPADVSGPSLVRHGVRSADALRLATLAQGVPSARSASRDATLLSPHRRSHPRSLRDRSPTVPVSLSLCPVPRLRSAIAPKAQPVNMGYHPLPGALLRASGRHMVLKASPFVSLRLFQHPASS